MKKIRWLMTGWLLLAATLAARGQVTNIGMAAPNQVRLEWAALPDNPYRVYATPDLVAPVWSNATPEGLVFTNREGTVALPMGDERIFYCAMASDYLIVDLAEGPDATNYPVSYTNEPPAGGWGDEHKTTKLVLRRIPGGSFMMGAPTNELGGQGSGNHPQHVVKLTKDFYIGVFETTQKQWERVIGTWPSYFTNAAYCDLLPVEQVSYDWIRGTVAGTNWPADSNVDADSFMGRLRTKTGQAFDLPTDAQWERACRSGTTNALNSGFDLTSTSNCVNVAAVARYWFNRDADVGTARAGSYQPSPWGLYDMHGNISEWCLDWYEDKPAGALDPPGPALGGHRVLRGGNWASFAMSCRSAYRNGWTPDYLGGNWGFRVCLPTSQP